MRLHKYHGLGNDYLVLDSRVHATQPTPEQIVRICHRNYGVGSDGILWGPLKSERGEFGLRIFNPDGSEAEKSGNGLRIFSRYLFDCGDVQAEREFTIDTPGGVVRSQILKGGGLISVEMGAVSFHSEKIPVTLAGPAREVINEEIVVDGRAFRYCAATVGNPHCVLLCDEISEADARRYGPHIETDPRFPRRTNVQFLKPIDRNTIQIEIWERGAGYTLASGSSSSAAAAVAHKLGLVGPNVTVRMPGGELEIKIDERFNIAMTGPVVKVCDAEVFEEMYSG